MITKSEADNNPLRPDVNIERIFNAPRGLVFKMWTDPRLVEKWWGPKGFTNPICKIDTNVGGAIKIVMQGPDGIRFSTHGMFREIIEPERLVFTSIKEGDDGSIQMEVLNTVIFEEVNGGTKMMMKVVVLQSIPEACQTADGMAIGWNQSIDRLDDAIRQIIIK